MKQFNTIAELVRSELVEEKSLVNCWRAELRSQGEVLKPSDVREFVAGRPLSRIQVRCLNKALRRMNIDAMIPDGSTTYNKIWKYIRNKHAICILLIAFLSMIFTILYFIFDIEIAVAATLIGTAVGIYQIIYLQK